MVSPPSPGAKSPSDESLAAAEELELTDEPLDDVEIKDEKQHLSPVADKKPTESLAPSPIKSPTRTPGKVRAAAAMFEKGTSPIERTKPTPIGSFRSIPASSSKSTLTSTSPTPVRSASKSSSATSPSIHELSLDESPTRKQNKQLPEPTTPTSAKTPVEAFSEISLSAATPKTAGGAGKSDSRSYSLSPKPPALHGDLEEILPDASQPPKSKSSFFSSALGLGSSASASSSSVAIESPKPSRSTSSTSNGTGWRSTMSNVFGSKPSTTPSPKPAPHTAPPSSMTPPLGLKSPQTAAQRSASTGFIVSRMDSPVASRDRRISKQDGGEERLREGFERVRGEMEDAAREMRRETSGEVEAEVRHSASDVDWVFWGAVVQDYEEVARERPRELSRAIQQGIPPVIRGAIWQLMSSSKSSPLEETYKALLKQTSPHEKAIAKDINRTFPNHKFFQEGGGVGQESLFMVVKAFSLYDEDVGYTQGLAFIVAALLLNMPDEEAFCVLVRLMDSYNLRSLFLADMPGLQLRLFQFDRLVEEILPLVHTHFIKKGVKSSMFASQWFMTLFSYRFPLSLVYRVLDIVFAEGIEAIFRFSLALLHQSESKLVNLEFEQILQFLQTDLFEIYRRGEDEQGTAGTEMKDDTAAEEGEWRANAFVRDAYEMKITPFMLDSYEAEYDEMCRAQNKHALELDQLRNANRSLSTQVKQLEASLATMNQEHVELVRQLVMSKIDKEETENELVRYKMLYAELAHAQQDALSTHSRLSAGTASLPTANLQGDQ